jgi:predicted LPLAT superfamily acyltransferase
MSERFYRFSTAVSRRIGTWFFRCSAWWVATGYFCFFPRRVAESVRFYRALRPEKSWLFAFGCAWRQFHNFTGVFLDRFLFQNQADFTFDSRGWWHLEEAIERKTGGVVLMSHVGNWEVAAHLLKRKRSDMPLLLYMGVKHKERIERMQKESLAHSGIRIVAVGEAASPFDIIEGIQFLRSGGLVSITGDVVWHEDQRTVPAVFLGRRIRLPEAPHVLALMSGAPLFFLLTFRTGPGHYAFSVTDPFHVRARNRSERISAIQKSVQRYASFLEATVRAHPSEWYHFRRFLGERLSNGSEENRDENASA